MMQFMLLFSRQGKLRLQKWYVPLSDKEKKKITRELVQTVLARKPKMCSFLEWRDLKIVYKRYASLYFCCAIEDQDNELITLEIIHRYVELLDKYFGSVCELDIIFNFEKAYFILDEFLLGGEAQETSKKNVLKAIEQADLLQEEFWALMCLPSPLVCSRVKAPQDLIWLWKHMGLQMFIHRLPDAFYSNRSLEYRMQSRENMKNTFFNSCRLNKMKWSKMESPGVFVGDGFGKRRVVVQLL
ncbi:AP-1 complex subunit sigma-2 isoform X1 [Hoplias malabaricus]|uniref:AP-1 complex subunit sigma-2 isoform X1 n=1 Tax=Hoplias malabaricus TaxID=27720 RepID=UPI00346361DD